MNITRLVKQHPVLSFCLLTLLWSFGWWSLIPVVIPIVEPARLRLEWHYVRWPAPAHARARYVRRRGGQYAYQSRRARHRGDAKGPVMDKAAMMRYLNEIMWFPTVYLGDNITWEAADDRSARVTFTDQGRSVSATMYFDAQGQVTDFVTAHYWKVDGGFALEMWSTPILEHGELGGVRLPVRGKAVWKLRKGDLEYGDVTITAVEYNARMPKVATAGEP